MLLMGNAMDGGYDDHYYFRKVMLGTAFITISIMGLLGNLYFLILHWGGIIYVYVLWYMVYYNDGIKSSCYT